MTHTVTLIPGDGIGPEVVSATRCVIEATGVVVVLETVCGRIPEFWLFSGRCGGSKQPELGYSWRRLGPGAREQPQIGLALRACPKHPSNPS